MILPLPWNSGKRHDGRFGDPAALAGEQAGHTYYLPTTYSLPMWRYRPVGRVGTEVKTVGGTETRQQVGATAPSSSAKT